MRLRHESLKSRDFQSLFFMLESVETLTFCFSLDTSTSDLIRS